MIVALCVVLIGILFMKYYLSNRGKSQGPYKKFHEMPCPDELPIVGNLSDIFCSSEKLWKKARTRALEYYPIYRLKILNMNIVHILHPDDIEMLLGDINLTTKGKLYYYLKESFGDGLATREGEEWQSRRKLFNKSFHFSVLHHYLHVFNREIHSLIDGLQNQINRTVDVVPVVTTSMLKIVSETICGNGIKMDDSLAEEYQNAIRSMVKVISYRTSKPSIFYKFSPIKKEGDESRNFIFDYASQALERYSKLKQNQDDISNSKVIDLLLDSPHMFDKDEMKNEINIFLFGGHDTASTTLAFALLSLANYSEMQEAIYEEMTQTVGTNKIPTYNDLMNMGFLDRFLKECLRLYPPGTVLARTLVRDTVTKTGYMIPAGTSLFFSLFDVHRNPNLYPDPLKFDPDRFLPENMQKRHPASYIAFGYGPRQCIAQRYALLEIKAYICGLLKEFKLERIDMIDDIEFIPDVLLKAKGGLNVKFVKRF